MQSQSNQLPQFTHSRAEAKVARVHQEDPVEFVFMTVKEIARAAHVSPPTVVRYCRTIGYSGFAELKKRGNGLP